LQATEDEDEISDISNDCYFLEALRQDLAKCLSEINSSNRVK
jgi:hypothetical protein